MAEEHAESEEQGCRERLGPTKLVVVKVGSSSLSDEQGHIDRERMTKLCDGVMGLRRRGIDVLLVSSGAIRSGRAVMSDSADGEISHLQALAAIGQVLLMEAYKGILAAKGCKVAQILLTWDDFKDERRLINLMNTFKTLLSLGVVPIVNENDTTAVDEIRFGDNDTLSALVAVHMRADLLILLSDVDGLYDGDPKDAGSKLISFVERVTADIERLATDEYGGSGGMGSKLKAARMVTEAGLPVVIANASREDVVTDAIDGKRVGTIFRPRERV